jgi:2-oxo-4-hydroxy-4-carboxy--5-ureidoimidazoline (OHCU) decarboxylase
MFRNTILNAFTVNLYASTDEEHATSLCIIYKMAGERVSFKSIRQQRRHIDLAF